MQEDIGNLIREEEERHLLGDGMYEAREQMINIDLDESDIEMFESLEKCLSNISSQILMIFGKIVTLYDIQSAEALTDPLKASIRNTMTHGLGKLALGMKDISQIKDRLVIKSNLQITGNDYFFVVLALLHLPYFFETGVNFIRHKKYLSQEFLDMVNATEDVLLYTYFEQVREKFKIIENMEILKGNASLNTSIH